MPIVTRTSRLPAPGGGLITKSVLPGGLRVITEAMPGARSASIGVWVGVGSADEAPTVAGASHYLEHLLFKGTAGRSALDIAAAIDAVGGELNAFTEKEHTCFYATVLDRDLPLAIDVVTDVVLNATVSEQDVDVERAVVLEEIAMRDDEPSDLVFDEFATALLGDTPFGRPILGTVASITALRRSQVAGYYRRRYQTPRMVVAIAGAVEHRSAVARVRRAFGDRLGGSAEPAAVRHGRFPSPGPAQPSRVVTQDSEQANLVLGLSGLSRHDDRRFAQAVLSTVLGGGMELAAVQRIRGPWPGLLGAQLHLAVCRRRDLRALRGLPARQDRRGPRPDERRARRPGRARTDCRGDRAREGPGAGRDHPGPGGSGLPHDPHRQERARVR
jgi:predicted Zn-dependent peptidase